jgi:casein kinase II subunit alpha
VSAHSLKHIHFTTRKDNVDQLAKIVSVLGTTDLVSYIAKTKVEITPEVHQIINKYATRQKRLWLSLVPSGCPVPSAEGIDLLDKLLVYDHDVRLTAQQAISHAFFDPVRDRVTAEIKRSSLLGNNKSGYGALRWTS